MIALYQHHSYGTYIIPWVDHRRNRFGCILTTKADSYHAMVVDPDLKLMSRFTETAMMHSAVRQLGTV